MHDNEHDGAARGHNPGERPAGTAAVSAVNPTIDKSTWGDGPWQTEPDRVEWEHAGLPCLALRNHHGAWCGYAAVPPGHPLHAKDLDSFDIEVHGGLTYASLCEERRADGIAGICHVPKPGDPADVWWLGFDCNHCSDFAPAMHARTRGRGYPFSDAPYDHAAAVAANSWHVEVYRTLAYVQAETNRLAEQLTARAEIA
jgi:hypothetical protein